MNLAVREYSQSSEPCPLSAAATPCETTAPRKMSARESLYLDLLRAIAALVVVVDHAQDLFQLRIFPRLGHHAVIVFFVLSGYVISYVADTREPNARSFIVARFARLWSVLVPAVVLTIVCDFIGTHWGTRPEAYADTPHDWVFVRTGAALTFLSQTWVAIELFSNVALWSLALEFWYYMIFAAWTFAPPGRPRTILVAAAAFMMGYKGLLLLPIWLIGVALQRSRVLDQMSARHAGVLFIGGGIAVVSYLVSGLYVSMWGLTNEVIHPAVMKEVAQARVFWLDWLFGVVVAAHLLGARRFIQSVPLELLSAPIRWCAGVSFAAYLFHAPLLHLCAAFMPPTAGIGALAIVLVAIAAIGRPVELSKGWWHRVLDIAAETIITAVKARQRLRFGDT